ncbi:class I SAM-dependent methyltransferase [Methanocella sp. CWC-04]|uniref:Class I SAM-dependent methyltransferase n=1 Tax=Methanooceanicella nereidis TaxID=2052831 RepID=A0AAP2RAF3_9EURY|nr:class I SAM-dependent methyltransferase [Methanocella sp. CWC-04]MCD1293544.1 class I SAM-dependent methyltransferase [Methanocella sp. CWC-04]
MILKLYDRATLSGFYNEHLDMFGYDERSLGWIEGTQEARFEALTAIADLNDSSVLDVGCGFGDLYGYLLKKGIKVNYTGVDINPGFIRIAESLHPDACFIICDFEDEPIEGDFDWAFESGMFNLKISDNDAFIKNSLRKMYRLCNKGLAADFLNLSAYNIFGHMHLQDPVRLYDFCRTLSGNVRIRQDYKPTEFCVYIYKD